ncbi:MAG: hypothetical protein KGQ57_00190 [Burkholderiales bacterium]|nr:hypothetical protein [Burkholderiales bacterium]
MNTLDTLRSMLHPGALSELRTWLFLAAAVAVGLAGWYSADPLHALFRGKLGDE